MTRSSSSDVTESAKKPNLPAPTSCFKIMSKWRRLSCAGILLLVVAVTFVGGTKHLRNREGRVGRRNENYNIEDEVEKAAQEEFREILRSSLAKDGEEDGSTPSDVEAWPWAEGEGGLGDPLCPSPNPRPRPNTALCEAKPCLAHDRCPPTLDGGDEVVTEGVGKERETACCYNGCVYTCMKKMSQPPAFDWVEETPISAPGNSSRQMKQDGGSKQSRKAPETVVISGGCMLSPEQYKHLEGFKQNEHIKKCFCDGGGVFCEVDRGKT